MNPERQKFDQWLDKQDISLVRDTPDPRSTSHRRAGLIYASPLAIIRPQRLPLVHREVTAWATTTYATMHLKGFVGVSVAVTSPTCNSRTSRSPTSTRTRRVSR